MGKKAHKTVCIFGANFMLEQIGQLEAEIGGAMAADDIESIHQMRVASRRLRNSFEYFKNCLPSKKSKLWQDEIRKITHALGSARDLDIQIECIHQYLDGALDKEYQPGIHRLLLRLKQRRVKAQKKVSKTLINLRESTLLSSMHQELEKFDAKAEGIYLYTPRLYQKSFAAINEKLEDFLGYEEFIHDPDHVEKLHAMRIAGKCLRYTIEIFAPIYKQAMLPYIQVMKELQDQLGTIHDADVWVNWLPKFIKEEESRIEDYFGNAEPLNLLLPGFEFLIEDRQQVRKREYQSFLTTWQMLQNENAWHALKEVIQAPINIEAALTHLHMEEDFSPEDNMDDSGGELTSIADDKGATPSTSELPRNSSDL